MNKVMDRIDPEASKIMHIAVVGGGRRCLSLLQVLKSQALRKVKARIVGVADINPGAMGLVYAQEAGIFTTQDFHELLKMDGLEMIINLTGSQDLGRELHEAAPAHIAIFPEPASRLFQEIVQEVLSASRRMDAQADEISRAQSFAKAMSQVTIAGVLVLDPSYRIVWINEAGLKATGLSREEAIGRYCFQVSHQQISPCSAPDTPCPMKETLDKRLSAHCIHEHKLPSGQTTYCDVSTFPLFNRAGKVVEVVEVIRDITTDLNEKLEKRTQHMKENLARLVQEDKLVALGKMVASVAHEINNPIASIINFSKFIKESLKEAAPTPEQLSTFDRYLDLTLREAQRCGKIVNSLLSFSRQQPVDLKAVDLCEIMEQIITLTNHRMELSNIELYRKYEQQPLEVWGDFTQLQQSFINLIFNAMEAMPGGGRLEIRLRLVEDGGRAQIDVSDTGVGISPENMPYIFEPFFTTKDQGHGVGLGLSMVYGIIREHRGEVTVKSQEGKGTTFTVMLPTSAGRFPEG
ncbi:MAG: ATP-binding protein [Thermodesulfobacteriota bacterium]